MSERESTKKADKENGSEGEECMKLELERKEKTRARKMLMRQKQGFFLGKLEERQ